MYVLHNMLYNLLPLTMNLRQTRYTDATTAAMLPTYSCYSHPSVSYKTSCLSCISVPIDQRKVSLMDDAQLVIQS